jgi:hypothetical protein
MPACWHACMRTYLHGQAFLGAMLMSMHKTSCTYVLTCRHAICTLMCNMLYACLYLGMLHACLCVGILHECLCVGMLHARLLSYMVSVRGQTARSNRAGVGVGVKLRIFRWVRSHLCPESREQGGLMKRKKRDGKSNDTFPFKGKQNDTEKFCDLIPRLIIYSSGQHFTSAIIQEFPHCSSVSLSVPHCSSVFLNVPQCSSVFLIVPQCSSVFLSVPQCSSVFLSVPHCSSLFLSVPQCSSVQLTVRNIINSLLRAT